MSKRQPTPPIKGRNIIGQPIRARRLKEAEKQVLLNSVESAMNDGRSTEGRIYWNETGVWFAPVQISRGQKLAEGG